MRAIIMSILALLIGYGLGAYQFIDNSGTTDRVDLTSQKTAPQRSANDKPENDATRSSLEIAIQTEQTSRVKPDFSGNLIVNWKTKLADFEQGNSGYLDLLKLALELAQAPVDIQQDFILTGLTAESDARVKQVGALLLDYLSEQNPQQALDMLVLMSQQQKLEYGNQVLLALSNYQPELAWRWIKQADPVEFGEFLAHNQSMWVISEVLKSAASAPELQQEIYQYTQQGKNLPNRGHNGQSLVAAQIARLDPYKALRMAFEGEQADHLLFTHALESLANTDPKSAVDTLLEHSDMADGRNLRKVLTALADNHAYDEINAFYRQVDDPKLKDNLAQMAAGIAAKDDLSQAQTWLAKIESENARRRAGFSVIHSLRQSSNSNLSQEIRFINQNYQQNDKVALNYYVNTYRYWISRDGDVKQQIMDNLPANLETMREQLERRLKN